jgi:hypothetical protein
MSSDEEDNSDCIVVYSKCNFKGDSMKACDDLAEMKYLSFRLNKLGTSSTRSIRLVFLKDSLWPFTINRISKVVLRSIYFDRVKARFFRKLEMLDEWRYDDLVIILNRLNSKHEPKKIAKMKSTSIKIGFI